MYSAQIESLLKEISPNHPSGEYNLEHDPGFLELEEEIQGTPVVVGPGGKIYQPAKDPNWFTCAEKALGLLGRTHDLRVAVSLTRALLHTEGFQGFHGGLNLICTFLDVYWDTVYPPLDPDDNDPMERVNTLELLSDWEMVISPLMKMDICVSRTLGNVNLRQYRIASGKASEFSLTDEEISSAPKLATIEAVFADCSLEELESTFQGISGSHAEVRRLESIMNERVGFDKAPDLKRLIEALAEIGDLLKAQLSRRAPQSVQTEKRPQDEPEPGKADTSGYRQPSVSNDNRSFDMIESRKDVLRLLELICGYYKQFEPASPVPLLLGRAMRLVEKNFVEILEDLAPAGLPQVQVLSGTTEV